MLATINKAASEYSFDSASFYDIPRPFLKMALVMSSEPVKAAAYL